MRTYTAAEMMELAIQQIEDAIKAKIEKGEEAKPTDDWGGSSPKRPGSRKR